MITKTKTKPKKVKNNFVYGDLHFNLDQFPGCCGIGCPCGFYEGVNYDYSWDYRKAPPQAEKKFTTREEQADSCYKRILARSESDYLFLQIALVSNYNDNSGTDGSHQQYPALQDKLIAEGWTINSVFINPNHGNEITVFSKHFAERLDKLLEENGWDGDDDEEEDDEF